jgi:flagellar secretion chaperone FliS
MIMMENRVNAVSVYRRVFLDSATPGRLLDELYGALLGDCVKAERQIAAKDAAGKGQTISHAIDIITELVAALDHTAAPELCQNLSRLYLFSRERLIESNARMDARPLADVVRVLTPIREAFQKAVATAP